MKAPEHVLNELDRWMEGHWQQAVLDPVTNWPRRIFLGTLSGAALESDFSGAMNWLHTWQDWAVAHGVDLVNARRRVHGTSQRLPTHLIVPDLDAAVHILGGRWTDRIVTARARQSTLLTRFPRADAAPLLRELTELSDVDFDLLLTAADWFRNHDAKGLTPRQVPIEGIDGKWLNTRQHLVLALSGKQDFGLVRRPRTVHFTYLDPQHLRRGGRRYDSATEGDMTGLCYMPHQIIITENKDTALFFPQMEQGIAIQGGGNAGPVLLKELPWVESCPNIYYWGDLDAQGFEIIEQYRRQGLNVRTLLMDVATLEEYGRFGVTQDRDGKSLLRRRKPLPRLTEAERAAYEVLTSAGRNGPYRLEQERIPLDVAKALLVKAQQDACVSLP